MVLRDDPELMRKYKREWVAKRRNAFFSDKSCVQCGSTERLELDHIDPSTKISHKIWSWNQTRREAELAKCQVLCHEHHLEKSIAYFRELYSDKEHGINMYKRQKCRCDICKEADRARRLKRKTNRVSTSGKSRCSKK